MYFNIHNIYKIILQDKGYGAKIKFGDKSFWVIEQFLNEISLQDCCFLIHFINEYMKFESQYEKKEFIIKNGKEFWEDCETGFNLGLALTLIEGGDYNAISVILGLNNNQVYLSYHWDNKAKPYEMTLISFYDMLVWWSEILPPN